MNDWVESMRVRVAAHPTLGSLCRFDASGKAYAEIDGRRVGSLTRDIVVPPAVVIDCLDVRKATHELPTVAPGSPGAAPQDGRHCIAERAYHGAGQDDAALFPTALDHLDDPVLIDADRVMRAVHAINFFATGRSPLLFLPVHDRLLKSIRYDHGKHFAQLLISLGLSPARIVIEIPPASSAHKTFLGYLLRSYRSYGFKVAAYLDDAGKVLGLEPTAMPDFVVTHAQSALRDGVVRPLVRFGGLTKVRVVFAGVKDDDECARLTALGATYIEDAAPIENRPWSASRLHPTTALKE